jgi:hydroxymethylbilane synthase
VPLRIGTRGSPLALAQSRSVAERLEALEPGLEVELIPIRTSGDEGARPAPDALGDKSDFVKEIEEALLDGRADLAVHSAKDLPGVLPAGLAVVAVPPRADARDALCGAGSIEALPMGARVGTSSLRRRSQLLAERPDLEVAELRGNVDTRLRRLAEGRYEAVVLATAGLERLGAAPGAPLDPARMTPAPGQGCLALEARTGDDEVARLAALLNDEPALVRLTAERALVTALGATCRTPVGAHAALADGDLTLSAFAGTPDGDVWVRDAVTGSAADPAALGRAVADRMLRAGAGEVLGTE